ncbi:thiolase family protein [Lampropedia aestuarii]|uniref:thiolase family protein n=1 Tax=Lampropedia aestuarii TaxID=2562762 RepID=UPI002469B359|nr:thiolase family protein [Lampropedia aestuarii]MDH5856470.1 thiolase family protein [Lampropedia aestuarii]
MKDVVIAGVGMTPFGYFLQQSVRDLAQAATAEALADASLTAQDIGFVTFSNAASGLMNGQECIRAEAALRHTGLLGVPMVNVENACASGATAFHLAWLQVASGQVDVALAVGAEKLSHPDKSVALSAMSAGTDLSELAELQARWGGSADRTIFMDIYAQMARALMARTGANKEDFARIAVKSHRGGALNPKAQFRQEVTLEQVLASRAIADPLHLLMCSPIGDGAAALVLMTRETAEKKGLNIVHVKASVLTTGLGDAPGPSAAHRAAYKAYDIAGIGPQDIHVAEVHDATASAELALYEDLGFCAPGEAVALLRSGATDIGGRIAVNSGGGLMSRGHPIGATGCAQLVELVDQLRHRAGPRQREGAVVAMAENGGGWLGQDAAVAAVTILTR